MAVLVGLMMFGGDGGYKVTAQFENGGQLVKGNLVTVGGRTVGTVSEIALNDKGQAEVEMNVEDEDITPLHQGTKATIRAILAVGHRQPLRDAQPRPQRQRGGRGGRQ